MESDLNIFWKNYKKETLAQQIGNAMIARMLFENVF